MNKNDSLIGERSAEEQIAQILRDNIHFSGQVGDYVIHGAIQKIIEWADNRMKAKEESLPEATDLPLYKMKEKLSHDYAVTFPEYQYQAARSGYEAGFVKAQFHFESKEDNKAFGEQDFCRMYNSFFSEDFSKPERIVFHQFTGTELMEFVSHCIKSHHDSH